jgi:hypothetical protein
VEHGDADCTVRGSASNLYLVLWNRAQPERVTIDGDPSVLDVWRATVQIRWS